MHWQNPFCLNSLCKTSVSLRPVFNAMLVNLIKGATNSCIWSWFMARYNLHGTKIIKLTKQTTKTTTSLNVLFSHP